MAKHVHAWYPISAALEPTSPTFKTKATPWGQTKPRGWPKDKVIEAGENVLWSCRNRDHRGDRCLKTLYYLEAYRLKAKGEFEEVEEPTW